MTGYETLLILIAWGVAGGSPGPATLAISGTAMLAGRRAALTIAAGIVTDSASWGIAAALGLSAVMLANAWVFEVVRYAGAAYLLYLAVKSLRRALRPERRAGTRGIGPNCGGCSSGDCYCTSPIPRRSCPGGPIYAIALPAGSGMAQVWHLFGMLISVSMLVFFGYGLLFSAPRIARAYARARRWFDGVFAALFGMASIKILTARLEV